MLGRKLARASRGMLTAYLSSTRAIGSSMGGVGSRGIHSLATCPSPLILVSRTASGSPGAHSARFISTSAAQKQAHPTPDAPSSSDHPRPAQTSDAEHIRPAVQWNIRTVFGTFPLSGKATDAARGPWDHEKSEADGPLVRKELERLGELAARVAALSSFKEKRKVIGEYPEFRQLLELLLSQQSRFHVGSFALNQYINKLDWNQMEEFQELGRTLLRPPGSLLEVFTALAGSTDLGTSTRNYIVCFVACHKVLWYDALFATFCRCLDRKLLPGVGMSLLDGVDWSVDELAGSRDKARSNDTPSADHEGFGDAAVQNETASSPTSHKMATLPGRLPGADTTSTAANDLTSAVGQPFSNTPTVSFPPPYTFCLALGVGIDAPYDQLLKSPGRWYVSRKLDGVRVMTLLDYEVSDDPNTPVRLVDVNFVSRAGKPFLSLEAVERALYRLTDWSQLRVILARDPTNIRKIEGGVVKRLCLDGEICLMRPRTEDERIVVVDPEGDTKEPWADDSGLSDEDYVEDFKATMSIGRKKEAMSHPSYFVFDMLPWSEVEYQKSLQGDGLGRSFGQRLEDCKSLSGHVDGVMQAQGGERVVRVLTQWPVDIDKAEDLAALDKHASRWLSEGWEGLILRKDTLYKGKRSKDVYKIKTVQDAEYVVVGTTNSIQSVHLPAGGSETRMAMASAEIEHKGTTVSVGSGWTAAQRLQYYEDPEELVGKQITVEYFGESEKAGREGKSLRHPRVKKVWEEGTRDI